MQFSPICHSLLGTNILCNIPFSDIPKLYSFFWTRNKVSHTFIYTTTHCSRLRLIVRSGLDVPTFATRGLHACHHARAPSGGRWNCGREISGKFCLNADFHVTFRDLLHAIKLKIRRLRPGLNLGTKGQHATSRQPKPQVSHIKKASWYVKLINYCGTFNR